LFANETTHGPRRRRAPIAERRPPLIGYNTPISRHPPKPPAFIPEFFERIPKQKSKRAALGQALGTVAATRGSAEVLPGGLAPPAAKFRESKEAAQFDKQKEWREVRPQRPHLAPHLFL
jgi:hypothetical protein